MSTRKPSATTGPTGGPWKGRKSNAKCKAQNAKSPSIHHDPRDGAARHRLRVGEAPVRRPGPGSSGGPVMAGGPMDGAGRGRENGGILDGARRRGDGGSPPGRVP